MSFGGEIKRASDVCGRMGWWVRERPQPVQVAA